MDEFLKKLLEIIEKQEDRSAWPRVAQLKPEDVTRHRGLKADKDKLRGEAEVLIAKLESLKAQADALTAEFWEHLYRSYNLPRDEHYAIEDTVVLKVPSSEEKKPKGKVREIVLCTCGKC